MSVFVDTSALYAALDGDDPHHDQAVDAFDSLFGAEELVTHNYVHVETEQLVRRRLGSEAGATLIDRLLPGLATIWVDEPLHASALAAIRGGVRGASLVDHVSFILMRRLGIVEALAFDADFEAEGFRRPHLEDRPAGRRLSDEPAAYGNDRRASDLVSLGDIASLSGRSLNTIQSWRRRHDDFPEPYVVLRSGPVWTWPGVRSWIARRGQR